MLEYNAATGEKRSRLQVKLLFHLFVVCMWLAVLGISVELIVRMVSLYNDAHNPYLQANWTSPRRSHPLAEPLIGGRSDLSWNMAETPSPPPSWAILRENETDEEKQSKHLLFSRLPEQERRYYSIGNIETVFEFDANGRIVHVYDNLFHCYIVDKAPCLIKRIGFKKIEQAASDVIASGKPAKRTVTFWGSGDAAMSLTFSFINSEDCKSWFAFCELEKRLRQREVSNIPDDSRWEILALRYKKNIVRNSPVTHAPEFTTNSFGFRSKEVAVPKPKNVFRILCIGGSTTEEGATDNTTYPALLERKLRDEFPSKAIEVINCGIEGMQTRNQFFLASSYIELDPDLMISYEGVNDAGHDLCDMASFGVLGLTGYVKSIPLNVKKRLWPSEETARSWIRDMTIADLDLLWRIIGQKGARFALCSIAYPEYDALSPDLQSFYDKGCGEIAALYVYYIKLVNDEIKKYCEKNRFLYIPVHENFLDPRNYLGDTCHMNGDGIERKTQIVFRSIRDYIAPRLP